MISSEIEALKNEMGEIPNFFEIVKKDLGIENNPKATKMLQIACDLGNSYNEAYIYALDLVELIR